MLIALPPADPRALSRARVVAETAASWGSVSRWACDHLSVSHGHYALLAESPESVSQSDDFDNALTWPPGGYSKNSDVADFLQSFLRSSPIACCLAEVGHAKAEIEAWASGWGPKPRHMIDARKANAEYFYFVVPQDAEDRSAVEEIVTCANRQFSVIACSDSRLLATGATIDVPEVLAEVVAGIRHLIFSACDGDAALVWTPCRSETRQGEPGVGADSR